MDLSASLYEILCTPFAAFLDPSAFLEHRPADDHDADAPPHEPPPIAKPDLDPRDPPPGHPTPPPLATTRLWRIDGSAAAGTRLFAVPTFLAPAVPLRIDCLVPDQREHSLRARRRYRPSALCCLRADDGRSAPMVGRVLEILDGWTRAGVVTAVEMREAPFGSSIFVPYLEDDVGPIPVQLHRSYEVEQQMLPVDTLRSIWSDIAPDQWPPTLDLYELDLQEQIHDTVSVVRIPRHPEHGKVVFKSSVEGCFYLYHEIQLLLSLPRHSNIVPRPLFLVTKRCSFGNKVGVCGFIIPYFPLGSLRDRLPQLPRPTARSLRQSYQWATEIGAALLHVQQTGRYYCDLRTDNIVLAGPDPASTDGPAPSAILIDLEQRGNWRSWSPPEVFHLDQLQRLAAADEDVVPAAYRSRCRELLDGFRCDVEPDAEDRDYVAHARRGGHGGRGANAVWNAMSPAQRESATVYMFGRLLWCLFERVGRLSHLDALWKAGPDDASVEFPTFLHCPPAIRSLIRRCTLGAPEYEGRRPPVYRVGWTVLPRGRDEATAQETLQASTSWWKSELEMTEAFLGDPRHQQRHQCGEPIFKRPTLADVLDELTKSKDAI